MESVSFTVMPATLHDIATIVSQRRSMFAAMGYSDEGALDAMSSAFEPWLRRKMLDGEYLAWFAITDDEAVAAGVGLWLMDWPPHMIGSGGRRGNLVNMFVRPENRRQGIARQLMRAALDWCGANAIDYVMLHSSAEGRHLYESLGFTPTNEMRLLLTRQQGA
ncbi:MAG: GNAT family N-acetyltransferase [Bryobacteraceae bacterium]